MVNSNKKRTPHFWLYLSHWDCLISTINRNCSVLIEPENILLNSVCTGYTTGCAHPIYVTNVNSLTVSVIHTLHILHFFFFETPDGFIAKCYATYTSVNERFDFLWFDLNVFELIESMRTKSAVHLKPSCREFRAKECWNVCLTSSVKTISFHFIVFTKR